MRPWLVNKAWPSLTKLISKVNGQFSKTCMGWPVFTSHNRTVSSYDAEASCEPSGENATAVTERVCPSNFCNSAPHVFGVRGPCCIQVGTFPQTFLMMLSCGAKTMADE